MRHLILGLSSLMAVSCAQSSKSQAASAEKSDPRPAECKGENKDEYKDYLKACKAVVEAGRNDSSVSKLRKAVLDVNDKVLNLEYGGEIPEGEGACDDLNERIAKKGTVMAIDVSTWDKDTRSLMCSFIPNISMTWADKFRTYAEKKIEIAKNAPGVDSVPGASSSQTVGAIIGSYKKYICDNGEIEFSSRAFNGFYKSGYITRNFHFEVTGGYGPDSTQVSLNENSVICRDGETYAQKDQCGSNYNSGSKVKLLRSVPHAASPTGIDLMTESGQDGKLLSNCKPR